MGGRGEVGRELKEREVREGGREEREGVGGEGGKGRSGTVLAVTVGHPTNSGQGCDVSGQN